MALEPITRQEQIIAGKDLEPITRMERFLKEYGRGSGGGGASSWNDFVVKVDGVNNAGETEWTLQFVSGDFAAAKTNTENGLPVTVLIRETLTGNDFWTLKNEVMPLRLWENDSGLFFAADCPEYCIVIFPDNTAEFD